MKNFPLKLITIFIFGLLSSCYDDQLNVQPNQKEHPVFSEHPSSGELEVNILSDGGQGEYIVKINGVDEKKVQANDPVYFALRKGSYEVELIGLDGSCIVSGSNPQIVNMMPKKKVSITFEVSCSSGAEQIVFLSNRTGIHEIFSMNVDGSNVKQLTFSLTDSRFNNPQLSPDGSKILFTRGPSIFVSYLDTKVSQVLTFHEEDGNSFDSAPSWSKDGKQIVFTRVINNSDMGIFKMDADGRNISLVVFSDWDHIDQPDFSPDGSKILYYRGDDPDHHQIYIVDSDGQNNKLLIDHGYINSGPKWSPDGTKILFRSGGYDGIPQLFLANADGSGIEQITFDAPYISSYNWSPDGSKIVYVSKETGNFDIYTMNMDGTNVKRLTDHPANDYNPSWGGGQYLQEDAPIRG